MPAVKKISQGYTTGWTLYVIVRRDADSFRLNDADGSFANAPADPYLSLAEDAVIKGLYEVSESRAVWNDGAYTVAVYAQVGGAPSPVADILIGLNVMYIDTDAEITVTTMLSAISAIGPAAVWDELLAAHTVAGTAGKFLNNANNSFGLAV